MKCQKTIGEIWQDFFGCAKHVTNLFQLVSCTLNTEYQYFSLINSKWRRDRNSERSFVKRRSANFHHDADCRAFYSLVIRDQTLLNAAAGNAKIRLEEAVSSTAVVLSVYLGCLFGLAVQYATARLSTRTGLISWTEPSTNPEIDILLANIS